RLRGTAGRRQRPEQVSAPDYRAEVASRLAGVGTIKAEPRGAGYAGRIRSNYEQLGETVDVDPLARIQDDGLRVWYVGRRTDRHRPALGVSDLVVARVLHRGRVHRLAEPQHQGGRLFVNAEPRYGHHRGTISGPDTSAARTRCRRRDEP